MKLLFLTADNLRSSPFIKDLVYNYKDVGKSIILHDHFGSIADTRFVTKRISALMSEEMILNNAFAGDQRSIFQQGADGVVVRAEFLESALQTVDLLLLNPLGLADGQVVALDAVQVLAALRRVFDVDEIHVFPKNVRSPLAAERRRLVMAAEVASLRDVYEEEATVLDMAVQLLPVVLAAPGNFKKIGT